MEPAHAMRGGAHPAAGSKGMDVDGWREKYVETYLETYPLVNCPITMENHHFVMGKSTISMAIFNSYVSLPEGNGV